VAPPHDHISCLSHFTRAELSGCTLHAHPHTIQLLEVSGNAPRRHQVLSPLHQRAVLRPRPGQTFEEHRLRLRRSIGSEVLQESDHEDERPSRSGQPSPDGSLEVQILLVCLPLSQPSPRASSLGSRNGSSTSITRICGAFRSHSRSRNTNSGSGSGSAGNS
jgi:hypothetical protein